MRTVDINNLTVEQVKDLNEICRSIKNSFNELTERIFNATDQSLVWLLNPLVSRNIYQSDLFIRICQLLLVKKYIDGYEELESIRLKTLGQYKVIEKYLSRKNNNGIDLSFEKKVKGKSFFKDLYKYLKKSVRLLLLKSTERRKGFKSNGRITFIDTFMLENSINEGRYIDRYYNGILEFIPKDLRDDFFFIPTIMTSFTNLDLNEIVGASPQNLLFKHDYLSVGDYGWILKKLMTARNWGNRNFKLAGLDITPLIEEEYRRNGTFTNSVFEGLLNYRFVKKLKKRKCDIRLAIDWNENQPIDKGLVKGFKEFYPETTVKGYQGYIVSTHSNFYIQPVDCEVDAGVIPDVISVIGNGLTSRLNEFSDKVAVETAPAFRFKSVYSDFETESSTGENLLVALPIDPEESLAILRLVSNSLAQFDRKELEIWIKPHPVLNINRIKAKMGADWSENFLIATGDFNKVAAQCHVVIGSASSALMETVARGIPVVVIGSQNGITQCPIPDSIDNRIWSLSYTKEDLYSAVKKFLELRADEKEELKRIGKQIKHAYFEPVTKKSVAEFLEIPHD